MPCRGGGKNSGRAVGEIGEALPVAEEASRFQGSAPIGGHDSDRKSVGTTVGNRRPLRKRYKGCRGERNPPVTASPCQPPFRQGGPRGRGMRIATASLRTGLAMTVFLQEVRWAGRCGERTERCRWQMKRGGRVAAVKILSVRRKAAQKFWAPQQDHRPLRNGL